ncbi:protein pitchfork isoform X2 [Eptesicus fuscus]|uniref:protein pitchfork isoform X2 n=1 Tax=Eptesicus fuscus TaxID=29078 RepID=UPI00101A76B3|nr:protein pitchfork isoform X2 [Eptesicus fuscus]
MELRHKKNWVLETISEKEHLSRDSSLKSSKTSLPSLPKIRKGKKLISHPFLWNFEDQYSDTRHVVQHPFGTGEEKKIFPHFHPHNLLGNKFLPLRGAPHRGPGCYTTDTDLTPHPATYQTIKLQEGKQKQSFAPFNVMLPRFVTHSRDMSYPGPDMYNPVIKPPPKVTWPMKFGSPDWDQIPCLRKRTLKAELPSDKDFRRYRNRMAYLSLFYSSEAGSSFTCSS